MRPSTSGTLPPNHAPSAQQTAPAQQRVAPRAACCSTSALEPLQEAGELNHHGPPAPFWQATLMAANSAPRPDLASCLLESPAHVQRIPTSMSEVLPCSDACSVRQEVVNQDEEHLRQHVQSWLDAAAAVSGISSL